MKITAIENFLVKSFGASPWLFCAVRTDAGITGYSEYGTGAFAKGLPALVDDIGAALIGEDPSRSTSFGWTCTATRARRPAARRRWR